LTILIFSENKVLMTGDARLNFEVKGDLVQEKGIRTRAKSKKGECARACDKARASFTALRSRSWRLYFFLFLLDGGPRYRMVPVQVRLFQLVARELAVQAEQAEHGGDDDDDDDGEDFDEDAVVSVGERGVSVSGQLGFNLDYKSLHFLCCTGMGRL
jgi:hypothetical protein